MKLLEKHFDLAFAAPDGIQKLRELILTLAMQGKLVPQDPNDQPASELLKAIEAERQRLVKEEKIKQPKSLPEIKLEDLPYGLPQGWEWVRLGEIGETNIGLTYAPSDLSDTGTPVLRSNQEPRRKRTGYRSRFAPEPQIRIASPRASPQSSGEYVPYSI